MRSVEQTMKNFLYSLFIGLFGIAALTSIAFLLMYAAQSKQQAHLYSDLAAVRKQDTQQETASEPEKQASYQNLYWENTDMVGWILIEDTNIDYPVMQTPTDPTYYLKHDFEKNYTDYGCPFMQADCDALAPSDNLILYGHNMKDGSMFAYLGNYYQKSTWENNPMIFFDTLTESHVYKIFAVFKTSGTDNVGFAYHLMADAKDEAEFNKFVATCKELSFYDTGITPVYGDKLLCLSTCEYTIDNGRFVVAAVRIS